MDFKYEILSQPREDTQYTWAATRREVLFEEQSLCKNDLYVVQDKANTLLMELQQNSCHPGL